MYLYVAFGTVNKKQRTFYFLEVVYYYFNMLGWKCIVLFLVNNISAILIKSSHNLIIQKSVLTH